MTDYFAGTIDDSSDHRTDILSSSFSMMDWALVLLSTLAVLLVVVSSS